MSSAWRVSGELSISQSCVICLLYYFSKTISELLNYASHYQDIAKLFTHSNKKKKLSRKWFQLISTKITLIKRQRLCHVFCEKISSFIEYYENHFKYMNSPRLNYLVNRAYFMQWFFSSNHFHFFYWFIHQTLPNFKKFQILLQIWNIRSERWEYDLLNAKGFLLFSEKQNMSNHEDWQIKKKKNVLKVLYTFNFISEFFLLWSSSFMFIIDFNWEIKWFLSNIYICVYKTIQFGLITEQCDMNYIKFFGHLE